MNPIFASAVPAPLIAFSVSLCLLLAILRFGVPSVALDQPNARSLHREPVPRVGGLIIAAGAASGWFAFPVEGMNLFWYALLAVFLVSLVDDLRGLGAGVRLLIHFGAAITVASSYSQAPLAWYLAALLALVWMTNLFNFMDGSDGLAGGMAVLGLGFIGYAGWADSELQLAVPAFLLASASLAFLIFNFHPARLFLGDAGSAPLGFAAAALGLHGTAEGIWPAWFPILVFSPFIIDATATLVTRVVRRENVLKPHREHYYQRLVRIGWGHKRTALVYYALMVAAGSSALWALQQPPAAVAATLAIWLLMYLVCMWMVNRAWKAHRSLGESDICPV